MVEALRREACACSIFRSVDDIHFHRRIGTLGKERMDNLLRVALEPDPRWCPRARCLRQRARTRAGRGGLRYRSQRSSAMTAGAPMMTPVAGVHTGSPDWSVMALPRPGPPSSANRP